MRHYDVYTIGESRTATLEYIDSGPQCTLKDRKTGSEIVKTIPWKQRTVFRYPKSCTNCPVGFSCRDNPDDEPCGRNVPWTDIDSIQRPSTCKLKLFDISNLIDML